MFSLPFPPSSNNLFPGKARRFPSARYKAWKAEALPQVPEGRVDGPYVMRVCVDRPDKRGRDLANLEKAIGDLIVEAKLVVDDRFLDRLEMWWSPRPIGKNARAHVWLTPVAVSQ